LLAFAQWLDTTSASQEIRKALWLIPLLQTIHILAIAMVLSSVAMVEMRILGMSKSLTMTQTAGRFMPWIWTGLVLLALSGLALIVGEPKRALPNPIFQIKMLMLAIMLAVTLTFQASLWWDKTFWEGHSLGRKVTSGFAVVCFLLWCAIAVAGRWIAYAQSA